ncbi:beta-N-acetylhexosaminidase [Mucilaginibacter sabulilitoris]|uniref:beta-N-acetylhexosaminidase n=1 Tax=Mucilaginibacter sabulilitoris TaxID=1173583 RepID=A0ABZ0TJ69_9SPHI|nr:beta-N-acetylhexosaminidase [Mucilaginibacter sabulilitoris]WPU92844.1 beta-N-acetylhexosaminidase [Mucilaginibacter sabulilitoris]
MLRNYYNHLKLSKIFVALFAGMLAAVTAGAQNIIPQPQHIAYRPGAFIINSATKIVAAGNLTNQGAFLQEKIAILTGYRLAIVNESKKTINNSISLKNNIRVTGNESYHLNITSNRVVIEAGTSGGLFYGCVSLVQLLPLPETTTDVKEQGILLRAVDVTDAPRFKWRGLMLDVSRTFMSPDYVKSTIDRMAFYKLNILHLHLTDDQGWRMPVKGYSQLNIQASRFDTLYHEPKEVEGYYTTTDIQQLVSYAASRNVELVPEIESPGHSHAALFAYPELLCNYKISPVAPFSKGPAVNDVFCVGNPATLNFFQTVIGETAQLFPSGYLHLGGDEVPRNYWQSCPRCQEVVFAEKLPNTSALQGYFMQKLHDFVVKQGKRPVAWDEILHDNEFLTKDWIVMSWTGSQPGLQAASKGYDVVMTPTSHMYFDYGYDAINTKKVFDFNPFEGAAPGDTLKKHILGIQANFWSHIDRTPAKTDYQLFPRILGLAERAWSAADDLDYAAFRLRQRYHRRWLELMGVNYYAGDFN